MNLKSCAFTLNKCLVIGKKILLQERKVYEFSHFEPLGLRCELTVMPLTEWYHSYRFMILMGICLSFPIEIVE